MVCFFKSMFTSKLKGVEKDIKDVQKKLTTQDGNDDKGGYYGMFF